MIVVAGDMIMIAALLLHNNNLGRGGVVYPETEWWVKVAFKSMYVTRGKFTFRVNSLQFIIKYWHPPHTLDKIPGLHTKLLYLYLYTY